MVFVELPIFIRCAESLFTDEDLAELQLTLLKNPSAGDLIRSGKGLRKLRVPLPGRGGGGGGAPPTDEEDAPTQQTDNASSGRSTKSKQTLMH